MYKITNKTLSPRNKAAFSKAVAMPLVAPTWFNYLDKLASRVLELISLKKQLLTEPIGIYSGGCQLEKKMRIAEDGSGADA